MSFLVVAFMSATSMSPCRGNFIPSFPHHLHLPPAPLPVSASFLQDGMGSAALAFDSFPAGLLSLPAGNAPTEAALQLLQQQQEQAYKLRHMNQHGFCYSRMLCGKSGPTGAEMAPGA